MPTDLLRWAASGELCYLSMAEVVRPVREAAGESVLPENIVRPLGEHHALLLWECQLAVLSLLRLASCRRPRPPWPDGRLRAPGQGPEADAAGRQRRGAAAALCPGAGHASGSSRAVHLSMSALSRCGGADAAGLQALLPVAADLFRVHVAGTLQIELQDHASLQPYAHLMAVLIVAARLCYQLDGSPRAHLPGVPPPPDWQGWARVVMARLRRQCAVPLDAREARHWLA